MTKAPPTTVDDALFDAMVSATCEGGRLTLEHFRDGARVNAAVNWKGDASRSPVTAVDLAVDHLLRDRLTALMPGAGWLSEETADTPDRLGKDVVIVVDPIDGTRGFMEGDRRYAVCVAIVEAGRPIAAIIHAPALDQLFTARAGRGATLNGAPLVVPNDIVMAGAKLAGPRFLTDPLAERLGMAAQPKVPSLALRFAHTAAGFFQAAVASQDSHDWDIAAADLILAEAGASLCDLEGQSVLYNRPRTTHGMLVAAATALQAPLRDALLDVTAEWRERERARKGA